MKRGLELLELLEEKINDLLLKNQRAQEKLKKCEMEVEKLKKENLELTSMIETQSVRVDALLKKLEEALKDKQKNERGVLDEKNGDL